ncbi:hypothetical protein [Aquabacterium sp. OR-4]|uniref:hypothetical protein n=1 Tax=Aquabacterium sp. OR-4 TaxID=2978127 RepID=UPI0021B454A8|nr:hypothetical protein [Aquabacterium sp. OR-4]MDT7834982.1 hypothetical protein [Aquabacterium sp. OR-4]
MGEVVKGGIAVPDRPQISVELHDDLSIEITVSQIGPGFDNVDIQTIKFPAECGKDVAKAIQALLKR